MSTRELINRLMPGSNDAYPSDPVACALPVGIAGRDTAAKIPQPVRVYDSTLSFKPARELINRPFCDSNNNCQSHPVITCWYCGAQDCGVAALHESPLFGPNGVSCPEIRF